MSRTKNFAKSGAYNILAQALFFVLLYVIGRNSAVGAAGIGQWFILIALILIPSAIWTLFFYLQDRIEPEPTGYVILSFLAGMAGASLLGLPLEHKIFATREWMYLSPGFMAAASLTIIGAVFSFVIYAIIRYGFYGSKEFDEPVDGMVYGALAGSGYAFVSSLFYLMKHPEFTLFAIGYTTTTNILMYASVGALAGYIVGMGKFSERSSTWRGFLAVGVGTILISIFTLLEELVLLEGFQNAFWISFALTLLLAVVILWLVYGKMRKLTERSLHQEVLVRFSLDYPAILLFLVLLALGGSAQQQASRGLVYQNEEQGISFKYPRKSSPVLSRSMSLLPAGLTRGAQTIFNVSLGEGGSTQVIVKMIKEKIDLESVQPTDFTESSQHASFLREDVTVAGSKGLRLKYSYLKKWSLVDQSEFPEIIWAITDIVPGPQRSYIFTFQGTPEAFRRQEPAYLQLLNSVNFK